MEHMMQPEVIRFVDQYYRNPQVESGDFLKAVEQELAQITDPDVQEMFVAAIIKRGRLIRDLMLQQVKQEESYQLKGDEF